MRMRALRWLAAVATIAVAGCGDTPAHAPARWRADCVPAPRLAPLGLDAGRDAQRLATRRHELRLREAASPGWFLRTMHAALDPDRIAAGDLCPAELADLGQLVFEHEYAFPDGLGGRDAATRPVSPFRRVHAGDFGGPETISCPSCHWVGGPAGAGAETDDAFLMGDGATTASGDARNPPALLGLGVVEALAREMTAELQRQRADLVRVVLRDGAARTAPLTAKGVDFGALRVSATGEVDASGLLGVDPDLIVKPFGWKGTHTDFAAFAAEALQVHIGIQSDALLAAGTKAQLGDGTDAADPDADGVQRELGGGPFAAMTMHLALLEMPIVEPMIQDRLLPAAAKAMRAPTNTSFADDFERGRRRFHELGCAGCHRPMLVLHDATLTLDGMPPIDLAREMRAPALRWDAELGGYPVWLFSDLKRHDMGESNRARHPQCGVGVGDYLTPRLWGVADSAPYLHDGRAPSLDYAIAGHDGEGAAARDAYAALPWEEKGWVRVYLTSLRREPRVVVP